MSFEKANNSADGAWWGELWVAGARGPRHHLSLSPRRLQSGMNLQICFVNDSSSDKDSDADDSKTETSLDTPLSPMVGLGARPTEAPERGNHEAICNGS